MARRISIEIDEFKHGTQPIPVASRVGNVVYTGAISGHDAQKGAYAEGIEGQTQLVFSHLRKIMAAAGASLDDIVRMTFYVKTPAVRDAINKEWVAMFPDPNSRPARHTINYETPAGSFLQCDAVAVIQD